MRILESLTRRLTDVFDMSVRQTTRSKRTGVAAVELALCMPLIIMLLIGTMDACSMIFLKQSLEIAAYEGARTALIPTATSTDISNDCMQVMTDRSINGALVTISPNDLSTVQVGDHISVTVSAPCDSNTIISGGFHQGQTVSVTVQGMKEFN